MFIKHSISKISKVFKDYNDFDSFVKVASKNDKSFEKDILKKIASFPLIKTDPDKYTLLRNRSISAGELYSCNQNYDYFPEIELKTKFGTFINARVSVDHIVNTDDDIIGIILSSVYVKPQLYFPDNNSLIPYNENIIKESLKQGRNIKVIGGYVENLLAVDNERAELHTPGIVQGIRNGEITDSSMGCSVQISECSVCGNKAKQENEFCDHILYQKGKVIEHNGIKKLCYEINHGLEFFEDSIILSEEFARKAGKSAMAGGEGADTRAKILEVLNKKKSITDYVKKSNYFGYSDEYIEIGEKPQDIVDKQEKIEDAEEERFEKESLIINDRVVKVSRLVNYIKNTKDYREFESNISGLIGNELSGVSRIKVKSFYDNYIKKSNKEDLMALVKNYEKQGYTKEQVQRKLSELDYSKEMIAEALAYSDFKDGYKKESNFDQLEDTNQMMDAYNTNLEDDGIGTKDNVGYNETENPLFGKTMNLRKKLNYNENFIEDNVKEPDIEDDEMIKYNEPNFENKMEKLKTKLADIEDEDEYTEEPDFTELKEEDQDFDEFNEEDNFVPKGQIFDINTDGDMYAVTDDKGKKVDRRKLTNQEEMELPDNIPFLESVIKDKEIDGLTPTEIYSYMKRNFALDNSDLDWLQKQLLPKMNLTLKQKASMLIQKLSLYDVTLPNGQIIGEGDCIIVNFKNGSTGFAKVYETDNRFGLLDVYFLNGRGLKTVGYGVGKISVIDYTDLGTENSDIENIINSNDAKIQSEWYKKNSPKLYKKYYEDMNKKSGVNTKDHLKQKDTLANGAGFERYDSIINNDERDYEAKQKNLEDYKDFKLQDKKYQTDLDGKVKMLKSRLSEVTDLQIEDIDNNKENYKYENADEILDDENIKGNMDKFLERKVKSLKRKLSGIPSKENPSYTEDFENVICPECGTEQKSDLRGGYYTCKNPDCNLKFKPKYFYVGGFEEENNDIDKNIVIDRTIPHDAFTNFSSMKKTSKSPPGWSDWIEEQKRKGMSPDEAFGIAWKQHNKGTKPPSKKKSSVVCGEEAEHIDSTQIEPEEEHKLSIRKKFNSLSDGFEQIKLVENSLEEMGFTIKTIKSNKDFWYIYVKVFEQYKNGVKEYLKEIGIDEEGDDFEELVKAYKDFDKIYSNSLKERLKQHGLNIVEIKFIYGYNKENYPRDAMFKIKKDTDKLSIRKKSGFGKHLYNSLDDLGYERYGFEIIYDYNGGRGTYLQTPFGYDDAKKLAQELKPDFNVTNILETDNGLCVLKFGEVDNIFSIKQIQKKLSEVMVPTELQPGSVVKVKDQDNGMQENQGQIQDVKEQVTEDGNSETMVELNDGKTYSTEDFSIDKQSMLQEIENIDFNDEKIDKLASIENLDLDIEDNFIEKEAEFNDNENLNDVFAELEEEIKENKQRKYSAFTPIKVDKEITYSDNSLEGIWEN